MVNLLSRELKSNYKSLLIWAILLSGLGFAGFWEYGVVAKSDVGMAVVLGMMPRSVLIIFGMTSSFSIDTPEGWYAVMYNWLSLAAYIHAALLGAAIISKEERDKTADFLLTRPISRGAIVTAKLITALVNVMYMMLVIWVTSIIALYEYIEGTAVIGDISHTMLGMLLTQLVYLSIGMLLSVAVSGRGKAGQYAAVSVLLTYFTMVMIEISGELEILSILSPFCYFDVDTVMRDGLRPIAVAVSLAIICVCCRLTYKLFSTRNIHN